jgi:heterodisulfide reductase subunit B
MVQILLQDAVDHGAEVIATTCPMCDVNLEVYQEQVNREFGTHYSVPVMYFTQLMGLALGIDPAKLGVGKNELASLQAKAAAPQAETK